jgi:AcrR family transcriptional regulator
MAQVRPMRADARRNYERLLKAAVDAFAEHGEGASLDDIAKRAGVGSGTLYRHFPTRHALLEAAYLDRIEAIAARADALAAELPPGEALVEWLYELGAGMMQMRGWPGQHDRRARYGRTSSRSTSCAWSTAWRRRRNWPTARATTSAGTWRC